MRNDALVTLGALDVFIFIFFILAYARQKDSKKWFLHVQLLSAFGDVMAKKKVQIKVS